MSRCLVESPQQNLNFALCPVSALIPANQQTLLTLSSFGATCVGFSSKKNSLLSYFCHIFLGPIVGHHALAVNASGFARAMAVVLQHLATMGLSTFHISVYGRHLSEEDKIILFINILTRSRF